MVCAQFVLIRTQAAGRLVPFQYSFIWIPRVGARNRMLIIVYDKLVESEK